jgi:hypothetical protein
MIISALFIFRHGYTAVKHQREVGTGYFDHVANAIAGGRSSTTALAGSTEEAQFQTIGTVTASSEEDEIVTVSNYIKFLPNSIIFRSPHPSNPAMKKSSHQMRCASCVICIRSSMVAGRNCWLLAKHCRRILIQGIISLISRRILPQFEKPTTGSEPRSQLICR